MLAFVGDATRPKHARGSRIEARRQFMATWDGSWCFGIVVFAERTNGWRLWIADDAKLSGDRLPTKFFAGVRKMTVVWRRTHTAVNVRVICRTSPSVPHVRCHLIIATKMLKLSAITPVHSPHPELLPAVGDFCTWHRSQ